MPADLRPQHVAPEAKPSPVDSSWVALIGQWRLVIADLSLHHGVDLYDPAVLARPWPGVRTMIFSLLDHPTRLRAALTRKDTP